MRTSKGFAPIIILVFVVLIVSIVGAYYLGVNKSTLKNASSPTPASSNDPTANWKTYTTDFYSLRYPSNWEVKSPTEGCGPVFQPLDPSFNGWVTICGPDINGGNSPEKNATQAQGERTLISKKDIKVDGHESIIQEIQSTNQTIEIHVYIGNVLSDVNFGNGSIKTLLGTLAVYYYENDDSKRNEAKIILNQILSTFKFTN